MFSRTPVYAGLAVLLSLGCGQEAPVAPGTPTPQPQTPASVSKSASDEPLARTQQLPPQQIESYRAALRNGRKLIRAKNYEAGLAWLDQALALQPGDQRVLAEMGWALFLKGDLDRAEQVTQQALRAASVPNARGAALHNLGRIAEQRGKTDEAAQLYRNSIAARPNTVVSKRLADLGASPAASAVSLAQDTLVGALVGPAPSLQATCSALISKHAPDSDKVFCEKKAAIVLNINEGELRRALLLPVWFGFSSSSFETATEVLHYLVIETNAGTFHTNTAAWHVYNPGAFGIYEELAVTLSTESLMAGSPREIVVRGKHQRHDTDLGILEEEEIESERMLVCGLGAGVPQCFADIPVRYSYTRQRMEMEDEQEVAPSEHTPGLPLRNSYDLSISFDGSGHYTLSENTPPQGDGAAQTKSSIGTFPLAR